MSSLVIYANEYFNYRKRGLLPQMFDYRILVEGDSWMDRSAMFNGSLPNSLAEAFNRAGKSVLIVNLAIFGDTMRRIGSTANGDFVRWMDKDNLWKFDAILLSAGGNDFIDAAADAEPGDGILISQLGKPSPTTAAECVDFAAIKKLVETYLDPNFSELYECVQNSPQKDTPIFLNLYDTPTARYAPAFPKGDSWLSYAYDKRKIPPALWVPVTQIIFNELADTVKNWSDLRANVMTVDTRGALVPASIGSKGNANDWLNEIHPNKKGWEKLAKIWCSKILSTI